MSKWKLKIRKSFRISDHQKGESKEFLKAEIKVNDSFGEFENEFSAQNFAFYQKKEEAVLVLPGFPNRNPPKSCP